MKKLNWFNMWKQMKSGSGSLLVLGLIVAVCRWTYHAITHTPEPEWSLGRAVVWLTIAFAYLLSSMFVALLTDDPRSAAQ